MIMARSAVSIGFDIFTTFCDVDFLVIFRVVGLKIIGSSVDSVVAKVALGVAKVAVVARLVSVAISASLKMIFRLIRTAFLTGSHTLNMVVASFPSSYSFSDRGAILPSCLACGLSAYAAHPKVLRCL